MITSRELTRSDARDNRRRILDAARDAFAASGEVSLNQIAKRAGVGPGTLYRHFPTREALILAVYRNDVDEVVNLAPALLTSHTPIEALRLWFDRLAHYGRLKYGVAEVIHAASSDGLASEMHGPIIAAIRQLLDACAAAGQIKPGIEPDDVLLLVGFLWRIDPSTGGETRAARMLDLVMDGLQPHEAG